MTVCGLGARDTLRLEAAMPLYGHELSDSIDPFSAGLTWAVKLDKGEFVGSERRRFKEHPPMARSGSCSQGNELPAGSAVFSGEKKVGEVTSGTFSPTLEVSLAMAYVDPAVRKTGIPLEVDVRGHREAGRVVKLPFYKRAKVRTPDDVHGQPSSPFRTLSHSGRSDFFTRILTHGSQIPRDTWPLTNGCIWKAPPQRSESPSSPSSS